MHEFDPAFRRFTDTPEMKKIAADIGFRMPRLVQSMYIFKQPRIGGSVSPHQDNTYLYTDPPSVVGFWVGLEDATKQNGCMWAVPGSHRMGTKYLYKRGKGFSSYFDPPKTEYDTTGAVPLETKAGTLVLLNGDLVHYSDENRSDVSRHAFTLHVVESDGTIYPRDNWLQRSDGKAGLAGFPTFSEHKGA